MSKEKIPTTPAILALKAQRLILLCILTHTRKEAEQKEAAGKLGVDEHCVIKTLVMEDETGKPLIILMHGDKEVSTKSLARIIGVKSISPCNPAIAEKHTAIKLAALHLSAQKKQCRFTWKVP
jgi:prolyl-tRNA editing enzyme YbaK/EbsC (Cys-tRNA(Pro) deacylase)